MNFKVNIFLLIALCSFTTIVAQKDTIVFNKKFIPKSIYTVTSISQDFNSVLNLNQRLNLKSFEFLILDEQSIEAGYFTLPLCSVTKTPTKYIYDSYNKIYHYNNLKQAFFKVSDLYKVRAKNPF